MRFNPVIICMGLSEMAFNKMNRCVKFHINLFDKINCVFLTKLIVCMDYIKYCERMSLIGVYFLSVIEII